MAAAFDNISLHPLGAGDLIDRTIRLYRRHFLPLIRASVPPVVLSVAGVVLITVGWNAFNAATSEVWFALYLLALAAGVVLAASGYVLQLVVMGGASYTLVRNLLWGEAVTTRAIYRSVRSRFWGLLTASLMLGLWFVIAGALALGVWFVFYVVALFFVLFGVAAGARSSSQVLIWVAAAVGLLMTLGAIVLSLWVFFLLAGRAAYVPQVMLVEGRPVFDAVARSAQLAGGNARRLMAMFTFTTIATNSVWTLLLIPLGFYGYLRGVDLSPWASDQWPMWYAISYRVIAQSSTILLTPVWMLGLSLLYVDERVQREGYDIELMAARTFGEIPSVPDGRQTPLAPAVVTEPAREDAPTRHTPRPPGNSVLGL
ncbi:MAG TPA: hypothetical protein VGV38_02600 [Pyrinomonadaceae bacterium]|nr:hypothetical protein [Pyrinomonadaceae bacterium]